MTFPIEVLKHHIHHYGIVSGPRIWARKAYLRKVTEFNSGDNVYESEWDVLVILDACRPDLLIEVASEYEFVKDIETTYSVGSATMEWMPRTFYNAPKHELNETIYVCGNPFSEQFLENVPFKHLSEVWKWGWDDNIGTVPPREVTDEAIRLSREKECNRLIVHYMQPHTPFIGSSKSPAVSVSNFDGQGGRVPDDWELIEMGERSIESVWEDYRDNLRHALNDVELLRENINADPMVISSDHGNAVGEHGLYGHPGGVSLPVLHEVPWCETKATDSGGYTPEDRDSARSHQDIEDMLGALGYN